jgi:hypothetical protein
LTAVQSNLFVHVNFCATTGAAARVFLSEEASGVTLQRTRAIGWSPFGGYDLSMRLSTFSQQEIINANFVARMWVTAIGEGGIGYNMHAGGENLLFMDDVGTPNLGAVAIHTLAVVLKLGTARSFQRLPFNDTRGPGPGPGNVVLLPTGPFRGYSFVNGDGQVVVAFWMADGEFGAVAGMVRLAGLGAGQLRGASIINTFGNPITTVPGGGGGGGGPLQFRLGRDVVYAVFRSGAVTVGQANAAVGRMLARAVGSAGTSQGWQAPFW